MTQRELAEAMGVQLSQVGDWERGAKAAGGENLLRIADATRSQLLGLKEPPELEVVRQHLAEASEILRRVDEGRLPPEEQSASD